MSILIKGIEKPEACIYWDEAVEEHKYCPFLGDSGYCVLQGVDSASKSYPKMYQDCLLSEVPAPHGDLIDREELLNDAGGVYTARPEEAQKIQHEINKVLFAIQDAPTVIEAEEGELDR